MKKAKELPVCSICGRDYDGFGNNASPFEGRCCDVCNMTQVIPTRISMMFKGKETAGNDKG